MNPLKKQRTYEFGLVEDNLEAAKSLTGLEYLEQMMNGAIAPAPAVSTNAIEAVKCAYGYAEFALTAEDFHFNAVGSVHGGVITTLLDTAMGCTLMTTLGADTTFTTLELKVNFLKAVTKKSGRLYAKGHIIHAGRTTAYIEAHLVDENERIFAHALSTCLILEKRR